MMPAACQPGQRFSVDHCKLEWLKNRPQPALQVQQLVMSIDHVVDRQVATPDTRHLGVARLDEKRGVARLWQVVVGSKPRPHQRLSLVGCVLARLGPHNHVVVAQLRQVGVALHLGSGDSLPLPTCFSNMRPHATGRKIVNVGVPGRKRLDLCLGAALAGPHAASRLC